MLNSENSTKNTPGETVSQPTVSEGALEWPAVPTDLTEFIIATSKETMIDDPNFNLAENLACPSEVTLEMWISHKTYQEIKLHNNSPHTIPITLQLLHTHETPQQIISLHLNKEGAPLPPSLSILQNSTFTFYLYIQISKSKIESTHQTYHISLTCTAPILTNSNIKIPITTNVYPQPISL
jgi:hypothetical protein